MKPFFTALLLLLFLYSNSQITVSNPHPSVTVDAKQVMYYNVDNPVIISTGTEKNAKITVKNGRIRKGDGPGKYFIRNEPPGESHTSIIVIVEANKKREEFEFFLRDIPFAPKLDLTGCSYRSAGYPKCTSGLIAYMKDFTFPVAFDIDSFSVTFEDSLSSITHTNKGWAWDDVSRNYFLKVKPKSIITIHGAWLKGTDGPFYTKQETEIWIR